MESVKAREKRLMDSFKLTLEKWETFNPYQLVLYALCGRKCRTGKTLATDHSHASGQFRGLCCAQCNPILGKLENAWVRLGMHKVEGITLLDFVPRLLGYLQEPPASKALGYDHFGYKGKVGTKKHRAMLKRLAKKK